MKFDIYAKVFVKNFISEAITTYPALFHDISYCKRQLVKLDSLIIDEKELSIWLSNFLNKNLTVSIDDEEVDWLNWLYTTVLRSSKYAENKFALLLKNLLPEDFDDKNIIVPGCGKFYEERFIQIHMKPNNILAVDISSRNLEFSRVLNNTLNITQYLYYDLTSALPNNSKKQFDIMLSIHPEIADWSALGKQDAYKIYDELCAPYELLVSQSRSHMKDDWKLILENSIATLKPGGLAVFILYERRDVDILNAWLECQENVVIHSTYEHFVIPELFFIERVDLLKSGDLNAKYSIMQPYSKGICCKKI